VRFTQRLSCQFLSYINPSDKTYCMTYEVDLNRIQIISLHAQEGFGKVTVNEKSFMKRIS